MRSGFTTVDSNSGPSLAGDSRHHKNMGPSSRFGRTMRIWGPVWMQFNSNVQRNYVYIWPVLIQFSYLLTLYDFFRNKFINFPSFAHLLKCSVQCGFPTAAVSGSTLKFSLFCSFHSSSAVARHSMINSMNIKHIFIADSFCNVKKSTFKTKYTKSPYPDGVHLSLRLHGWCNEGRASLWFLYTL